MEANDIASGFRFDLAEDKKSVELTLSLSDPIPAITLIESALKESPFKDCLFSKDSVQHALGEIEIKKSKGQETEASRFKVADRKSATLHLEVTTDRLTASLVITSAFGGNNPSEKLILAYLKKQGVTEGIQHSEIRKYCTEIKKLEPGGQVTFVAARGRAAKNGIPCEFKWVTTPFQDRDLTPVQREDGTTDMYDLGAIETVSPGDVVMTRIPAQKSDDGINVFGDPIQSIAPPNIPFSTAEGVKVSEDDPNKLIATRPGIPMRARDVIRVDDILVLETVDLTTGHIEFDGSVMIKGPVRDGLHVDVTGDIHVRDLVESATLHAGGNILVKKGILGRKVELESGKKSDDQFSCVIEAQGDIDASYMQYASVKAGGSIKVKDQLLNCYVKECEELIVGGPTKRKAKLVGGTYHVRKSAIVGVLGSDSYVTAELEVGMDVARIKSELEEIKANFLEKQDSLARCQVQLEKFEAKGDATKVGHFTKTIKRVGDEVAKLRQSYDQYTKEYKELLLNVSVTVYGESFPGSQLHFGKFHTTLQDASKACRFKFTKMGLKKVALKKA